METSAIDVIKTNEQIAQDQSGLGAESVKAIANSASPSPFFDILMDSNKKIVLYMQTGCAYITADGVVFSEEHPFQLVEVPEAAILLVDDRFRKAEREEVRVFYNL
jgi:hypothetical protein